MIYFLVYLFLEIFFTITFGKHFGALMTFFEIIGSFFVGLYIMKEINFSMRENMVRVLKRELSAEEFISMGLFKFFGAVLLMIPGIFSDILGVLMQFEFVAVIFADKFLKKKDIYDNTSHNRDDVIDVEIIEDKSH